MVSDLVCRTADTEYYYFMASHKGKKVVISKPLSVDLDFTSMVYAFEKSNKEEILGLLSDPTMGLEVESYLRKQHMIAPLRDGKEIVGWTGYFDHYVATPRQHSARSDKEMRKLLTNYITKGYNVDERLVKCYATDIVHPTMSMPADLYMPYNDHQIVYTNPGTGKTKIAERTSMLTTRMSSAWMKGFSSSQKSDTHVGGLSGMTSTITFDEFQSDDKFVKNLPSIYTVMDSGMDVTLTGHGAPPVDTRFKLRLCGNPGDDTGNADYELLMLFNDFLEKSTDNYQAMGRRFGLILFSNDFTKVKGSTMSQEEFQKAFYEWSAVSNSLPAKIDDLMMEPAVNAWLNKPHERHVLDAIAGYEAMMGASLQQQVFKRPVRAFVSELGLNYRRMRGMALKLGVFHLCWSVLEGKASVQDVLDQSEIEYKYIIKLQMQSLDNLFGVEIGDEDMNDYYKSRFALLSGIEKALLKAILHEAVLPEYYPVSGFKLNKYYDNLGHISSSALKLDDMGHRTDIMTKLTGFGLSVKLLGDEIMVMCPSTIRSELLGVGLIGDEGE